MENYSMAIFTVLLITSWMHIASSKPNTSAQLFEGELTALLIAFLAPLDPATIAQTKLPITADNIDVQLLVRNAQCTGFSNVEVTGFDPPFPLISNEMKLSMLMDSVQLEAPEYNMTGHFNGIQVAGTGTVSMSFENLRLEVKFATDEFSTDPLLICVEHGSFHLDLMADVITGTFEGMPEVNENMQIVGPIIIKEMQSNINSNWESIENALNEIYC